MPQYMLLLHEEPSRFRSLSAEEMQAVIERYKAWSASMAQKGHLRGGQKLQDGTGRVIRPANGKGVPSILDGPYSEGKEVIGGFFTIEAAHYEQAVELARTCPHADFGPIEVREVEVV